jgi:hypothetical protein
MDTNCGGNDTTARRGGLYKASAGLFAVNGCDCCFLGVKVGIQKGNIVFLTHLLTLILIHRNIKDVRK